MKLCLFALISLAYYIASGQQLVAVIEAFPQNGPAPLTVTFDASKSQGNIITAYWDFGDGNFAYGRRVVYTYTRPGDYLVTLTLYDPAGNTASTSVVIKVERLVKFKGVVIECQGQCVEIKEILQDPTGQHYPGERILLLIDLTGLPQVDSVKIGDLVEVCGEQYWEHINCIELKRPHHYLKKLAPAPERRKVKIYVYAIDDVNRSRAYQIDTVAKIAGAQIRVDYPGGSQVLTTTMAFPGPFVEVNENSTVTVSLVAQPPGWRFTNYWDIFGISWASGPSRTFNVGTSNKHVAAAFTRVASGCGTLRYFDLDYRGTPPNSDNNDQHSVTVTPGTTLTLFFRYNECTAGNQYIIRVYPEWDKNRYIANSDNDETISELGQEIGGYRWDRQRYTVPNTPGTYKVRVVYSATHIPPTWDKYDRLLAEGTVVVTRSSTIGDTTWLAFIDGYPSRAIYIGQVRQNNKWIYSPIVKPLKLEGIPNQYVFGNFDINASADRIVFCAGMLSRDGKGIENPDVFVGSLNLATYTISNIRKLHFSEDGVEEDPRFFKDGTYIVLKKDKKIYVYNLITHTYEPITGRNNPYDRDYLSCDNCEHEDWAPFVSPSGDKIVFTRRYFGKNSNYDEICLAIRGQNWNVIRLTYNQEPDWYPVFLSDDIVVFVHKKNSVQDDDLVLADLSKLPRDGSGFSIPTVTLVAWKNASEADPYPLMGSNLLAFISNRGNRQRYQPYIINMTSRKIEGFRIPNYNCIGVVVFNTKTLVSQRAVNVMSQKETSDVSVYVMNIPNPIQSTNTTTFIAIREDLGIISGLKVSVYDLTGKIVWEAEALGSELVWHTEDFTGRYLANGVYLFVAYVKIDGEWLIVGPQKIVILR